jgi:hypothetical protein
VSDVVALFTWLADHKTTSANFPFSLFDTTTQKHFSITNSSAQPTLLSSASSLALQPSQYKHASIPIRTAHRRAKASTRNIIHSPSINTHPTHSSTQHLTAAMSFDRVVSIIAPAGRRKNFVALEVPVKNLAAYSMVARHHFFPGPETSVGRGRHSLSTRTEFDLGEGIDEGYARTIAAFIKNADPKNPQQITLALFGPDLPVSELVKIWRIVGHGFKFSRLLHDDSIREDLRHKMYRTTPYTTADFKLICDNVEFDRGLVHSSMDRVTFLYLKGYLAEETKQGVEDYCKNKVGQWDSLLTTLGRVQDKIGDAANKKAVREQRQQGKAGPSNSGPKRNNGRQNNNGKVKASASQQPKAASTGNPNPNAPRQASQPAAKTNNNKSSGNKGKGKGKAKVQPFVRKDDDFPPLA